MKKFSNKHITITWKFDFDEVVTANFSNQQWADLSKYVVEQVILPKIERGVSPVNGERMFQKYKDPKSYPGNRKQNNKPNLALTGTMLSYYDAMPGESQMEIYLGMPDSTPKEEMVKAKANNSGTQSAVVNAITSRSKNRKLNTKIKAASKGIPARPFIPKKGQTYTRDIILAIRKYFAYCLDQAIKKGNKE